MKTTVLAAGLAALAVAGAATSASASITVLLPNEADNLNGPLSHGQVMLDNFDDVQNANVQYTGNVITLQDPVSTSAAPPYSGGVSICCQGANNYLADDTHYASVQGGGSGTFSVLSGYLTSFSFYMGSPDSYNQVTFNLLGGGSQTFSGDEIWGGSPFANGDRTVGYRVYYDFGGAKVTSINFTSASNAFEFDGLAGNAVPEPASWALMIAGFGAAGAMLRSRRRALA
jgi:hypothetical protein